jgi:hypothetical protein
MCAADAICSIKTQPGPVSMGMAGVSGCRSEVGEIRVAALVRGRYEDIATIAFRVCARVDPDPEGLRTRQLKNFVYGKQCVGIVHDCDSSSVREGDLLGLPWISVGDWPDMPV